MKLGIKPSTMTNLLRAGLLIGLSLCIAACGESRKDRELQRYIQTVKEMPARTIEKIPSIEPYKPYRYPIKAGRDPFKPIKIAKNRHSENAPDHKRVKEPLEAFPLDALHYVGRLEKDKHIWALLSAPDGVIYRLQLGQYIGKHYGQVKSINEKYLSIMETIPGPDGWQKREVRLDLNK